MDFCFFHWLQLDESSFYLPAVCMATMNYDNTHDDDDEDDNVVRLVYDNRQKKIL